MSNLSLAQLSTLHYTIVAAFGLSLFLLAIYHRQIEKNATVQCLRLLGPTLFVVIQQFNTESLLLFKAIMLAESAYFGFNTLAIWFEGNKKNSDVLTVVFIIASLISSVAFLIITPWQAIFEINLRWLVILQVSMIMLNGLTIFIKIKEKQDFSPFIFNGIGSILLTFMFTVDGLFFMLLFRIGYYGALLHQLHLVIMAERAQLDIERNNLEKDFQETVRKEVNHRLFYMELSREKMSKIAKTDDLTGAFNKKTMLDDINQYLTDKKVKTFSILMFDIDKFKTVNDTMGHIVGDKCLKTLAQIARESIRDHDRLYRYGGDEFLIILPEADLKTAVVVADRFRRNIEKTTDPHFTVSIGIANYPVDANTQKALVHHADEGLYVSKEKGRNRVSYFIKQPMQAE